MSNATDTRIKAQLWVGDNREEDEPLNYSGAAASVEVERDEGDANGISLHTFVDGRGSLVTYSFNREDAIRLARDLLNAAAL